MSSQVNYQAAKHCLFRQHWWLDSLVGKGNWDSVSVSVKSSYSIELPYSIQKKYGFTILTMPSLTQSLGPLINGMKGGESPGLSIEKDLYYEMVEQLPYYDAFNQNFHWSITNWLPLYWKGFEQSTRYTYRLEDLSDIDIIWSGFMSNIRREIKKAENRFGLKVHSDYSVDRFLDLNEMTFARQNKKLPYSRSLVHCLDDACSLRGCRKIFYAEDDKNRIHAAIYLVWDDYSAYYLMGGGDPELRNSGATSLAMWEAIKFAATVTKSFDFEGSMIEPVERFFRGFGAKQVPYFHIWHFKSTLLKSTWYGKNMIDSIFKGK